MNKHFKDTRYYLKRAGETAKRGVSEELEPLVARVEEIRGEEEVVEQSRLDELRSELRTLEDRAEGKTKEAIGNARAKLEDYRQA